MKELGILCHVTSLPCKYGIGDFGKSAYKFIDFLKAQKISIWQTLPLNIANSCNCPYGAMSFLTIDPMFVDVEALVKEGLLDKAELKQLKKHKNDKQVDFSFVRAEKARLLEKAYKAADEQLINSVKEFAEQRPDIYEFAVYTILLKVHNTEDWRQVPKALWKLDSKACQTFIKANYNDILSIVFQQYVLISQWEKVMAYAKVQGVTILGDTPIYCDRNSFEVFRNPEYFKLDRNFMPKVTGGCPPDAFCVEGQNWGTCIYNWAKMREDGYDWWIKRFKILLQYFDIVRLDHFIGYVEHFENNNTDFKKSKWVKEGGEEFFNIIKKKIDMKRFVVEDLGPVTEEVMRVKNKFKLKGMNILQQAFGSDKTNPFLPDNVTKNSIYYLGTHDNNTYLGYLNSLSDEELDKVKSLLQVEAKDNQELLIQSVNKMLKSKSETIILQAQDFLLQREEERMNVPGRAEDCWHYRMPKNYQKLMKKTLLKLNTNKK